MKNKQEYNTLIAVLGWEDRFYEGIKSDLDNYSFHRLILLRYTECDDLTEKSRELISQLCNENKIDLKYLKISDLDTVEKWKVFDDYFSNEDNVGGKVLLEISTMPRDTIWSILYFLNPLEISIDYIYHTPKSYSSDWLTKEPGKPRLLFKHSGISKLGAQTALIILTGFEVERTKQLVQFFEPKLTYLGLQKGNQFDNKKRNAENHESIKGFTETKEFVLDAYADDNGYSSIKEQIDELKDQYNVIVASLGPKPTSIAMYRAFLDNSEIALAYVPAKEFNKEYSTGIDTKIFGTFK